MHETLIFIFYPINTNPSIETNKKCRHGIIKLNELINSICSTVYSFKNYSYFRKRLLMPWVKQEKLDLKGTDL